MALFGFFGLGLPELIILAVIGFGLIAVPVIVLIILLRHKGGEPLPFDDDDRDGD